MPIIESINEEQLDIHLWQINEDITELTSSTLLSESEHRRLKELSHPQRKNEFLATRLLLQKAYNINAKINYLPSGKPTLNTNSQISISHTNGYACIALSNNETIGVDIELISNRASKVYQRFLSLQELSYCEGSNFNTYCTILWCVKECVYKMLDKNNVVFNVDIVCKPFKIHDCGKIEAEYKDGNKVIDFNLKYKIQPPYILVYGYKNTNETSLQ